MDASASGAQGVINRHPSGAHGNLQGVFCWSVEDPRSGAAMPGMFAMSSLGASVADMAASLVDGCAGAGITQAKPLPTRVRLASSKATKTAVIRRARRMFLNIRGDTPREDPVARVLIVEAVFFSVCGRVTGACTLRPILSRGRIPLSQTPNPDSESNLPNVLPLHSSLSHRGGTSTPQRFARAVIRA